MRSALLAAALVATAAACQDEPTTVIKTRCVDDDACGPGFICDDGECRPADDLACGAGGRPILQPSPPRVDFGPTGSGTSEYPLILRNIGDCTVTVFEAILDRGDGPFECPKCRPERFPIELFPFRETELTLFFTPESVGTSSDAVVLLSDDTEYPELRVPVRARFDGIAAAVAAPASLDFDFVSVGRSAARTVEIRNRGTGTAALRVLRHEIDAGAASAFTVSSRLDSDGPAAIQPLLADRDDRLVIDVRYHPTDVDDHAGDLVVTTTDPDAGTLRIPLRGTSRTPAQIAVAPAQIGLGNVIIGQTGAQLLTIVNEGGSPLRVDYRWGGTGLTTDLYARPQIIPAIAPGALFELTVFATATAPNPIQGILIFETNDPMRPTVSIPVSADGQAVLGAQVVKIDMNFENGEDGTFDDDFRNVDLALENPFGLVVDKARPMPTNWAQYGEPSWLAFGPKEEPERIVLPNAQQDGTYRVLLTYQEDCASVPSGLVAALLGITVEALITYLTSGTSLGITAGQVSSVIESLCLSRTEALVTLTVYINGDVVAEIPVTMQSKNQTLYAADIVRENGQFTVRP